MDVAARRCLVQKGSGFVLVQDAGALLPDIEILFANGEQHRDILRLDDVPFAEACSLELAGNDLCDVVAEHLPDSVFGTDEFHAEPPLQGAIQ